MRSFITFILLCTLFILGNQNTVYSQDEKTPMLMLVQSERALPNKVFEYEDAQKNANEFIKKYLPSMQLYAYSSEEDTYYYVMMIESLGDIEKMDQALGEATVKSGKDEMKKVFGGFRDKVFSMESDIYLYDKGGSYIPKEPRLKPEEAGFERWIIFEFYPYYDQEALTACTKEIREFYEKNNDSSGFNIYKKVLGGKSNIAVMSQSGKNRIDFLTYQNEWNKKYWEEFKPLYLKYMNFVKDYKIIDVWFRKDLSVMKEKTK